MGGCLSLYRPTPMEGALLCRHLWDIASGLILRMQTCKLTEVEKKIEVVTYSVGISRLELCYI